MASIDKTEHETPTMPPKGDPPFGALGRAFVHTFETVIRSRDFRMLWIGMVLAMGGFQMQMVVRGILVYDITGNAALTGLVGVGFAPSLFFVSLYGGVLGDRVERRLLIQISQGMNGLFAGIVAILLFTDVLVWWHLFCVSVAQGAMFALQMPARQAAIPSLVNKDQLPNAFALNAMAMSIMTLVAPAIGGVLYELIDPKNVYIIVSIVMMSAVLFTGMVPKMYPQVSANKPSMVDSVIAGFKYIGRNKIVLNLMIYSVVVALLSMPFRMLVQVYAKDVYGSEPSEVGMLLTALGLGGLVGTVSIANLREGHKRGWIVLGGAFVAGLSLGLIVGVPYYYAGVIGMVGMGLAEQARWALGQSLMMENSDDEYRSRVMSVLMMTFGLMPVGLLPLGFAIEEFGARPAVGVTAVLLLLFATSSIFIMPKLRRLS
jgi:MFS family permease